ncbi:MAG: hypothetical protein ABR536_06565 [Solirubrobacterales bacterium]
MEGVWPIIFLAVILKIPVLAGMYLVWYAVKAEPELEEDPSPGEQDHGFRRWRREPRRPPRGPRRGDHGGGALLVPERAALSARRDAHRRGPIPASSNRR